MIAIFTGLPGAGKSLKLADTVISVLYRNQRAYKKAYANWLSKREIEPDMLEPQRRVVFTNLKMSTEVEQYFDGFIKYWTDLKQLTPLRDCDVVIDEVATYFDARLWETLSLEMRRWLAQHRKFGIEIYGTSQDFAQVDKAFRRLTSHLLYLRKLIGSRDISATKPPPKYIWGLVLIMELDPTTYDEQKSKFARSGFPRFMFISKERTSIFDTRAEVKLSQALPLKHLEKACERADCPFHKVVHV